MRWKFSELLFMIDPASSSSSDQANVPISSAWNYEATVTKIEAIIKKIEAGELELAEVFDQFTVAVEHLRQCENFLASRQQQMDLLIEMLADEPDSF